jgi:hypothetical protein
MSATAVLDAAYPMGGFETSQPANLGNNIAGKRVTGS